MIYLIFDCVSANRDVTINEEFDDYARVKADELKNYDLNAATRLTLSMKGYSDATVSRRSVAFSPPGFRCAKAAGGYDANEQYR